jgi:hypothetical protein
MEARISAVRYALWQLLFAAALCAVLTLPAPGNRTYMRALREAQTFAQGWKREEAEAKLLAQARMQGAQPLRALVPPSRKKGGPSVGVLEDALPIAPVTSLALGSLAAIRSFGAGVDPAEKTVAIGVPELGQAPAALAWRIARRAGGERVVLKSARVVPAQVSAEDVAGEADVTRLMADSEQADRALREAEKKLAQAQSIVEARQKRRMPWKAIVKAREAQAAAQSGFDEKSQAANERKQAYEAAAVRALASHAELSVPPLPAFAVLRVDADADGKPLTFELPVPVSTRSVPVSALASAAFPELVQAGLWDEVASGTPEQAPEAVARHFNWHMRELAPGVPGVMVLSLAPCLLPVLLAWLLGRIRALEVSYSPFTTQVRSTGLPRPGFKQRWLELLTVLVLPILACALAALSLTMIAKTPTLPVLSAGLCFFLGVRAFGKLAELNEMVDSVVQSHSYPPVA